MRGAGMRNAHALDIKREDTHWCDVDPLAIRCMRDEVCRGGVLTSQRAKGHPVAQEVGRCEARER